MEKQLNQLDGLEILTEAENYLFAGTYKNFPEGQERVDFDANHC